jgi:peroxiredoxin
VQKSDSIWTIESFPKDFLRMTYKDYFLGRKNKVAIKAGFPAPDWTLPMLKGDSVKLSDLKGSLVLLEFWFPGCGACMLATSGINDIQEKYGSKGLKVLGIEFQLPGDKGLTEYIEKHKIKYPTLYKGKSIAPSYGVSSAPTFFLINKDGTIIYTSSGFDKEKLIAAINENIK